MEEKLVFWIQVRMRGFTFTAGEVCYQSRAEIDRGKTAAWLLALGRHPHRSKRAESLNRVGKD